MIVTLFRSRVKPEAQEDYMRWAARISEQAQRAWSVHPEHVKAKKKGRESFYLEYRVQICNVQRDTVFPKLDHAR